MLSSETQIVHLSVYLKLFHRLSLFLWFLLSILPSLLNVNISIGYAFRFTDLDSTKCNVSFIPKFHYFFISLIIIFITGKSI